MLVPNTVIDLYITSLQTLNTILSQVSISGDLDYYKNYLKHYGVSIKTSKKIIKKLKQQNNIQIEQLNKFKFGFVGDDRVIYETITAWLYDYYKTQPKWFKVLQHILENTQCEVFVEGFKEAQIRLRESMIFIEYHSPENPIKKNYIS